MTRAAPWLLAALLVAAALITPWSHDETQYYAAARLATQGLPYRDFVYLQTPLFAWAGAGLALLAGPWLLVAGRIVQALLGLAVLATIARSAFRLTGDKGAARLALASVACSYPFLFSATVFRNDMLPLLLESGAVALLAAHAGEPRTAPSRRLFLAGLLITLAASAKVNFALLGIAPALWVVVHGGSWADKARSLTVLAAGALLGLVPTLVAIAAAPEAALAQIVTFASHAPHDWYRSIGEGWRLGLAGRAFDALVILVQGPALVLLVLALLTRRRRQASGSLVDMLDLLSLAALVAALVPAPSWRQYFVILLPPLALRAALWWQTSTPEQRRLPLRLIALGCLVGLVSGAVRSGSGFTRWPDTVMARETASHRLGSMLGDRSGEGAIVTLAPEYALDSGLALDPAFAAGPFVYRWPAAHASAPARPIIVTAATLARHLRAHPPLAIVTGQESGDGDPRRDLDRGLRDWAASHAYRPVPAGDGEATIYIAPLLAPWGEAKRAR